MIELTTWTTFYLIALKKVLEEVLSSLRKLSLKLQEPFQVRNSTIALYVLILHDYGMIRR